MAGDQDWVCEDALARVDPSDKAMNQIDLDNAQAACLKTGTPGPGPRAPADFRHPLNPNLINTKTP